MYTTYTKHHTDLEYIIPVQVQIASVMIIFPPQTDLGVWISSTLHPSVQCQKSYAKAMQSLATIKRTFKYITKESFNILYKTYIRSCIEYCVQAWNPYHAKDIDLLEKV